MAAKRTTTKSTKTPAARRPSLRRKLAAATPEEIATRAYYLHLEGGVDQVENWLRAERELVTA
ncbi:MAG: hypothetical protein ACRDLK_10125 [Gaiellaceae bacterium]